MYRNVIGGLVIVLTIASVGLANAPDAPAADEPQGVEQVRSLVPLPAQQCEDLRHAVEGALGVNVTMGEAPFIDYIGGIEGSGCQISATGTGENFGHFTEVAARLSNVLEAQGFSEDMRYIADGPTGTAQGFRREDTLALIDVGWEPAEDVECPEDVPIFMCDIPPEKQLYTVSLDVAEEVIPEALADEPDDASTLEALALRLLAAWGDPGRMVSELEPGRLPADLPFDLPLPEEAQLLGSLVRRDEDGRLLNMQAVVDAYASTEAVMAFFKERLTKLGWTGRIDPQPGGFVPAQASISGMYCAPDGEAFIHINSFFVRGRPTDVRLDINLEAFYTPCPDFGMMPFEQAPLPTLHAPAGSDIFVHGGILDREQASSSATITSGLPLDDLAAHYEVQLEAFGWQRVESEQAETLSHSRWSIIDERTFAGTLIVSEVAAGRYYASLLVLLN